MTTKRADGSYQSLGKGVYRVSGAVQRSAVTGGYVTKSTAGKAANAGASKHKK